MIQLKTIHAESGETVKVENQWAAECEKRGTTISTSKWVLYGAGALASQTLSGTLTSVLASPTCTGLLTNTVTLANGEVLVADRKVMP